MVESAELPWESAFVHRMKVFREEDNMSQTELAKALAQKGLAFHQQTIQRIENGTRPVRLNEAILIAELFSKSVEEMTLAETPTSVRQDLTYWSMKLGNTVGDATPGLEKAGKELQQLIHATEQVRTKYVDTCRRHNVIPSAVELALADRQLAHAAGVSEVFNSAAEQLTAAERSFITSHEDFVEEQRTRRRKEPDHA
jgi:DNA-binding XRE family transcriptional regulator